MKYIYNESKPSAKHNTRTFFFMLMNKFEKEHIMQANKWQEKKKMHQEFKVILVGGEPGIMSQKV